MSDYVLRPYQLHAIETLSAELRAGCGSILFVAPTGSGKTIVTAHAAARAAATGASIVIIVHRDELIRQTSRTLTEMSVQHGIIAAGYPENEALVQIASVMSLVQRLDRWGDVFKLAICDEAHHAVATTYRRVLTTIPYRIGLTATPERTDGQGLRELFNKMVVGPSVKELVAAGYLVPAVTYGPAVAPDLSQVKTRGGDYAPEGLEALMAQSVLIGDVVQYYRKFAAGRRALYYCISIEHSRQVAAAFCAAGFRAGHVDGDSGDKERERAIAGLADGSLDVLTNVLLFSEGLDIPPLEAVGILRPTKSSGLHRQMNGRPLRPAPGKKNAIIIDHSGNSFRHGLYDYEPRWSLEGRRREESEAEGEAPVQCCPNAECGALIASSARHCPHCGTVLARRGRVPQQTSGQLEQINEDHQLKLMLQYMPYRRAVEWAEGDYDRLAYVGRVRGYKPGWAYYQWCDAKGDNPCWGRSTLRRSASMSSCCTGSLRR